jgi:hypothetical protein
MQIRFLRFNLFLWRNIYEVIAQFGQYADRNVDDFIVSIRSHPGKSTLNYINLFIIFGG